MCTIEADAGAGTAAHVHRGAGDRTRGRHARRTAATRGWPGPARTARGRDRGGRMSAMPSATLADSRLSSAARSATASAAESRPAHLAERDRGQRRERQRAREGADLGDVEAGQLDDQRGRDHGEQRRRQRPVDARGDHIMRPPRERARPPPRAARGRAHSPTARTATTAVFSPSGLGTPSAAGTCWRKMITAMPTVNPSTTGHGTKARKRPSRGRRPRRSGRPAMSPTTSTASAPWRATIGTSTTVMAPVGPGHLHVRPAEHRRDEAGDDRGDEPGLGTQAGGDAEGRARGGGRRCRPSRRRGRPRATCAAARRSRHRAAGSRAPRTDRAGGGADTAARPAGRRAVPRCGPGTR